MAPLNLIQIFLLFVLGQGLFLSIMLFSLKKGDQTANRLLSGVVLLITYYTFTFFLYDTGYRRFIPILIINGYSIVPLIPVMFYFYLKRLTTGEIGRHYYLHLIPFALQFLYWLPNNSSGIFHQLSDEAFASFYSPIVVRSVSGVHILILAFYNYLLFTKIKWDIDNKHVNQVIWLRKIRYLYATLTLLFSIGTITLFIIETDIVRHAFFFFLSFIIYLVGYSGYSQSDTLFNSPQKLKPRYFHSKLSRSASIMLYEQLVKMMVADKVYLNQSIKLVDVAQQIGTTSHDLSRAINENYGQNFMDFINKYRVDEAKRILSDHTKSTYKMFEVAFDSGFGNKVTFYKNFKKFTGSLPAEFRVGSKKLQPQKITS